METRRLRWAVIGARLSFAAILFAAACASDPPSSSIPEDDGQVDLGTSDVTNWNYDGRDAYNASQKLQFAPVTHRLAGRFVSPNIAASMDLATGVTRTLGAHSGYLTDAKSGTALEVAQDFALLNNDVLGLTADDVADMEVTDSVYSEIAKTTHVYYRQRHAGLPVYNGQLHINVRDDGRVLSVNNAFMPNLSGTAPAMSPRLTAAQAIQSAASNVNVKLPALPVAVSNQASVDQRATFSAPEFSKAPIAARLMWLPINAKKAALVWQFDVELPDGNHWFDYTVDAETGKVWTRFDWVKNDSYRAYNRPVESANHSTPAQPADGRTVISNPANATASPQGWHNDGTTAFTIHRGNNAHAYDDRDANNAPPATQPACTATRDCDFPINYANAPSTYTSAAITNLFFWGNVVHDVQYQYGFNEAGGNFQVNNFGKGGVGNDAVRLEAQDGGGTNNANFATPAEGSPPRMQMFEWTTTTPRRDGDVDNGIIIHEYGHGISSRQVGGPSAPSCLNNSQQGGEGWSDWFGLWYTAKATDTGPFPRGIGTYALGQPTTGAGIRTQRYSTDPAVNTHTYASIAGKAIPHGVGEVWAQAIWEVYWGLVDKYGFSTDPFNANGNSGNQRAMLYINQGLKNTICQPTFVNARDGIIQAATSTHGGEDVCLLWEKFAAFGLGTNAVSGGPNSTTPTNGFQIPASCACSPSPVANAGPDQSICPGQSVTIGTPAVAGNTYSWSPGGQTTAQVSVSPAATTTFTVTANTTCGSASDSVVVNVGTSGGTGFFTDFESGTAGWTTTGALWHLTTSSTCAPASPSPTHSFYYGQDATCNYATAAANTGDLTSPPISGINASSVLTFNHFRRVEAFNGSFDQTQVAVVRADGTTANVFTLDSRNASSNVWNGSGNISLSAFAGQTIRLRFRFNTVDATANNFTGWMIDDVRVTGGGTCP